MKTRTQYVCNECGAMSPRWMGRCHECGAWNSFHEELVAGRSEPDFRRPSSVSDLGDRPVSLAEVVAREDARIPTGIGEFDRVIGGGLVRGSVVLVGGEPGIGKSTLLLQVLGALAGDGGPALYVSGEESLQQLKLRADRLGVRTEGLYLLCETSVERVLEQTSSLKPRVLVVDSIQTMTTAPLESAPGSVSQVRESAASLIRYAKSADVPVFLVGHVTKEGALAGPKVLEHMVDTVVYFEGDRHHAHRIVRATKNRFGSTNELAVFEMSDRGLVAVENPSELFLSQRQEGASGSVVICTMEGSRPLLLELQALVSPTRFGNPMRVTTGLDRNRVALLIAVLEKRGGVALENADVFVNVTGGVEIDEPAADLGVVIAMASNVRDAPLDPHTALIGEVGLGGEIRAVSRIRQRLAEVETLGFTRAILARHQTDRLADARRAFPNLECVGVANVREALRVLL